MAQPTLLNQGGECRSPPCPASDLGATVGLEGGKSGAHSNTFENCWYFGVSFGLLSRYLDNKPKDTPKYQQFSNVLECAPDFPPSKPTVAPKSDAGHGGERHSPPWFRRVGCAINTVSCAMFNVFVSTTKWPNGPNIRFGHLVV